MSYAPLRYFCEVVTTGSIREASEALNVAPSAVSRQIQNLEADFGIPLFERHARGMRLTEAGDLYYRFARQTLQDEGRVQVDIDELKGMRRGKVRVYAVEGIVASLLMTCIGAFRSKFPGINFQLIVTGSEDVQLAVREAEADVGITFNTHSHPDINCVGRWIDRVVVVVSPRHCLAGVHRLPLASLCNHALALPDRSFGIRSLIDQQGLAQGVVFTPALEANSLEALRIFAASDAGLSVMTLRSVSVQVATGGLVAIPIEGAAFHNAGVDVCVHANRRLPKATAEFVDTLLSNELLLPF